MLIPIPMHEQKPVKLGTLKLIVVAFMALVVLLYTFVVSPSIQEFRASFEPRDLLVGLGLLVGFVHLEVRLKRFESMQGKGPLTLQQSVLASLAFTELPVLLSMFLFRSLPMVYISAAGMFLLSLYCLYRLSQYQSTDG